MRDNIQVMKLLKNKFGICRLNCEDTIPEWVNKSDFYSVTRTMDELSIVVSENCIPDGVKCERSWRMFKVLGPLDFSLIGILSSISTVLAKEGISIYAISTYDTDYILVKEENLTKAVKALGNENYEMIKE